MTRLVANKGYYHPLRVGDNCMTKFIVFAAIYTAIVVFVLDQGYTRASKGVATAPTRWAYTRKTVDRLRWLIFPGLLVVPGVLTYLFSSTGQNMNRAFGLPSSRGLAESLAGAASALLGTLVCVGVGVVLIVLLVRHVRNANKPVPVEKIKALRDFLVKPEQFVERWGSNPETRLAAIRKAFDDATTTLSASVTYSFVESGSTGQAKSYLGFTISRSLASMDPRARQLLRATEMLAAAGGDLDAYAWRRTALIWGGGKAVIDGYTYRLSYASEHGIKDASTMINWYMGQKAMSEEAAASRILEVIGRPSGDNKILNAVCEELRDHLFGSNSSPSSSTSGTSNAWLKPSEISNSIFAPRTPHAVTLGLLDDGTPLTFSGDESLITIAPPGSGKTQCSVFPTLLSWKGPALVLDVSGDIYEKTSKWRAENVGPVFKFAPLQPEQSHKYSPLSFVRSAPDYIWEDSRLLAELMIVPSKAQDPFWENNARIFLTAAIASVVYSNPPESRPMHGVLDTMHGGDAWEQMMTTLRLAVDVRAMTQHATSISSMEEKTRDSVRQTVRSSLAAWSGERVARATSGTDWSPMDLRNGSNSTVYIVVQPHEVDSCLSLLRVFIGQHIRMLFSGGAPKHGSCPTLIMLDEMPRLKHMPPIDEALNIGRRFGLRLWMFAQSFGQIEEAYQNAEGMVASCGVRIYMNPSAADGTAESISEQIGYRSGPMDGNRQLIVEPNVLAGTAFKDYQIVLGKGSKPAKVRKAMAWQDPEVSGRFGELALKK